MFFRLLNTSKPKVDVISSSTLVELPLLGAALSGFELCRRANCLGSLFAFS